MHRTSHTEVVARVVVKMHTGTIIAVQVRVEALVKVAIVVRLVKVAMVVHMLGTRPRKHKSRSSRNRLSTYYSCSNSFISNRVCM